MYDKVLIPQNFPFRVEFAGLKGDLHSLQRQGWELAVDSSLTSYDEMGFTIAGRHSKLKLSIVSGIVKVERHYVQKAISSNNMMNYFEHIVIPISFVAPRIEMVVYGKPSYTSANFANFGMRELDVNNIKRFTLEELGVFKTFGNETELYVPEKKIVDVQEFLKDILVSQEEKQREIRQRILRENERETLSGQAFSNAMESAPKLRLVGY